MKKWLILLLGLFILGGCGKSSQPLSEKQAVQGICRKCHLQQITKFL
ncbi:hypothetical protein V4S31_11340 [Enterococcus cecorum]